MQSSTRCVNICAGLSPCRWALCCCGRLLKVNVCSPEFQILIHQVGRFRGSRHDIEFHAREALGLRKRLDEILAAHTGQEFEKVERDTERDYFMNAEEALAYGIIDKILEHR